MPPPDAVSVTLPPVQNVVEPVGVIVAVAELTVTTLLVVAVQPLAAVTVTVYVAAVVGLIAAVVAAVLHK